MNRQNQANAKVGVVNDQHEILLLRRSQWDWYRPGTWDWPGGMLEIGETALECAIREAEEEAGLILDSLVSLGLYPRHGQEDIPRSHLFGAVVLGQPDIRLSSEHCDEGWFPLTELSGTNLPPKHQEAVADNLSLFDELIQRALAETEPVA